MAEFSRAEEFTKGVEGGYVNDPRDNGGETIFGISRKSNPSWDGWRKVDEFKKGQFPKNAETNAELYSMAREFYRVKYWNPLGLHSITSEALAGVVYDFGVNAGIRRAGETLQRALNFLNRSGRVFPELLVDGNIGEKTIDAANKLFKAGDDSDLVVVYSSLRVAFYVSISESGGEQDLFARSWLGRCRLSIKGKGVK